MSPNESFEPILSGNPRCKVEASSFNADVETSISSSSLSISS
ncbi:8227_t:CDS:2 [Ambispora leptoticha]|uniref:8227_t:CDS:1 n=1 Tax=Ambispora leptoticha TaxID=144679 RepID=A0A9N8WFE3_9GLOM|nr:8227_t:CDS:2 [Ambispora leptoticha]